MSWRKRFHAWMMSKPNARYERAVSPYKRDLLGGLEGTILEIGPGAGVNLKYYPATVRWIGLEPNPYLHPYIQREARRLGRELEVRCGSVMALPMEDNSADAVVSTLVLCSVADQRRALAEVLRVLRPGGKYVFVEHVAAPLGSGFRRLQDFLNPVWRVVAAGCNANRETWSSIEAQGFTRVDYRRFRAPAGLVRPHIAGTAVKAA